MSEELKLLRALCSALGFKITTQEIIVDDPRDMSFIEEFPNKDMTVDKAIEMLNDNGFNWIKLDNGTVVNRTIETAIKLVKISQRAE